MSLTFNFPAGGSVISGNSQISPTGNWATAGSSGAGGFASAIDFSGNVHILAVDLTNTTDQLSAGSYSSLVASNGAPKFFLSSTATSIVVGNGSIVGASQGTVYPCVIDLTNAGVLRVLIPQGWQANDTVGQLSFYVVYSTHF